MFVFADYSPHLLISIAVLEGRGLEGVHYPPLNLLAPVEPGVMRKELWHFPVGEQPATRAANQSIFSLKCKG